MGIVDFDTLRFGEPLFLWLLVVPALLLLGWAWRLAGRQRDLRHYRTSRLVPVAERFPRAGDHVFWLAVICALALTITALARPQAVTSILRSPGVDLVLLLDGSTSMRVRDVGTDRWRRSMQWVRTLTQTLSWSGDRMAIATFADIAVPQVRLTRDPNTILFFLDHLDDEPTFRLENDTSWNTNVEDAIYWGVKLVDTDQEMYGRSPNARSFVVISDGQVWSGDVARAIAEAARRGIAVDVVGIGTANGGVIPLPRDEKGVVLAGFEPIRSTIDRGSLQEIARAGGGEYFEIGAAPDGQIAARIIQNASRRSSAGQVGETHQDLYWYLLAAGAALASAGVLFLRQPAQLAVGLTAAAGLVVLAAAIR